MHALKNRLYGGNFFLNNNYFLYCILNFNFIKAKIIYFLIYFTYQNLSYNNFNQKYIFKTYLLKLQLGTFLKILFLKL